jgi:hypothetical protein
MIHLSFNYVIGSGKYPTKPFQSLNYITFVSIISANKVSIGMTEEKTGKMEEPPSPSPSPSLQSETYALCALTGLRDGVVGGFVGSVFGFGKPPPSLGN